MSGRLSCLYQDCAKRPFDGQNWGVNTAHFRASRARYACFTGGVPLLRLPLYAPILVVDDDVEITTLLTRISCPLRLCHARCGRRSRHARAVGKTPSTWVVLDVMLPGADGIARRANCASARVCPSSC